MRVVAVVVERLRRQRERAVRVVEETELVLLRLYQTRLLQQLVKQTPAAVAAEAPKTPQHNLKHRKVVRALLLLGG